MKYALPSPRTCRWQAGVFFILWGICTHSACAAAAPPSVLTSIHHVFIVVLENESYSNTFGSGSPAVYLNSLRQRGATIPDYYATSHFSLGNYLTLISGQAPNPATNDDCEIFEEFVSTGTTADGQAIGRGCVYPAHVQTLANQLNSAHLSWKGYMEDMGNNPQRESARCGHPAMGAPDQTQVAEIGDQYAARHNPFVYFHAVIDSPTCAQNVVNLSSLATDLKAVDTTPNYAFITPNLCHDGHDGGDGTRCVNGEPGGLVSADLFLRELVPRILASPAYKRDGLLIITLDESEIEYEYDARTGISKYTGGDAAACCDEQPGPNLPAYRAEVGVPTATMNGPGLIGPGGGRIGAVLLSPFIRPGTVTASAYNHYSLLRSVEDIFGLGHLGLAAQSGLKSFGTDIFNRPHRVRVRQPK